MSYGYMRPDPVEQFKSAAGYYDKLIKEAEKMGYSKNQAIELLKVYALLDVANGLASSHY